MRFCGFLLVILVAGTPSAQDPQQASPTIPIETTLAAIDDYVVRLQLKDGSGGTGFVVRFPPNNYIITAEHVINGCATDEPECVFSISSWYTLQGKKRWLDEKLAIDRAKLEAGEMTSAEFKTLADEAATHFDERIPCVVKARDENWDVAILQVVTDIPGHPFAPGVSPIRSKFKLTDSVYLYGKPYLVRGKYPGVLRSGVVGGYFDFGDQSRLLLDIRTTQGDSGAPVVHVDTGRIIGIAVGSIVKERKTDVTLRVETGSHVRTYDLSDEVSGICSVVPYFYVNAVATRAGLWPSQ